MSGSTTSSTSSSIIPAVPFVTVDNTKESKDYNTVPEESTIAAANLGDVFPIHNPKLLKPYRKRSKKIEEAIHKITYKIENLQETIARHKNELKVVEANLKLEQCRLEKKVMEKELMDQEFARDVEAILKRNRIEMQSIHCGICFENQPDKSTVTLRNCGHGFHTDCIMQWFYNVTLKHTPHTCFKPALPEEAKCPKCKHPYNIRSDLCPVTKDYKEIREKKLKIDDSMGYQLWFTNVKIEFNYRLYSISEVKDMRSFASTIQYPYVICVKNSSFEVPYKHYYPCVILYLTVEVEKNKEVHCIANRDYSDLSEAWEHFMSNGDERDVASRTATCTFIQLICFSDTTSTEPILRTTNNVDEIDFMLDSYVIA